MGTWLASSISRGSLGSGVFHLRTSVDKFTSLSTSKVSWLLGDMGHNDKSLSQGSGFVLLMAILLYQAQMAWGRGLIVVVMWLQEL